jgi:hypothetical protein
LLREGFYGSIVIYLFNDIVLIGERSSKLKSKIMRISGQATDKKKQAKTKVVDLKRHVAAHQQLLTSSMVDGRCWI